MKIGFDNEKYLTMQSEHIKKRIGEFGDKLYLEFGGKLFDDFHASRVLPGFAPDSKLRMLLQLTDQSEIVIVINAADIEKNKVRHDLGITYDEDVLRLIQEFRDKGLYVGMPSKPDKSSKTGYRDTAKPITGEFRKQLHGAILTAYSAEIGRLQAVAAAQERPSIKDQLEAGAKEAAKEKAARPPKEKPAKGAER